MKWSTLATASLKPDEEMRPVLDAKPTPKFYEVIEARTIMTQDLEHCVKAKSPVFMPPGGCRPPGKERPWLRRGTANERTRHDRFLGL